MAYSNWFAILMISIASTSVHAQEGAEQIEDNSFLIEEAYNQKSGEVQHILTTIRDHETESVSLNFAQEWPLFGQEHQISYDVPFDFVGSGPAGVRGLGDISINYRYQMLGVGDGPNTVSFAPRISLILPTGNEIKGLGNGVVGGEINLPLSVKIAPTLVAHTNAGVVFTPNAKVGGDFDATITELGLGQSIVWLVHEKFNVLLEALYGRTSFGEPLHQLEPEESFVINPGIRWAHDFDSGLQIVPGVSVPIGIGPDGTTQVLIYLSFEHGF